MAPVASPHDRSRVVPEEKVLDELMVYCWPCDVVDDAPAARRRAAAALERWVEGGLGHRVEAGRRLFDVREVVNFLKSAALDGGDPAWRGPDGPQFRRLVGAFADAPGDARFEVAFARTFNLAGRRADAPLRLGLPVPVEDPAIRDVEVELTEGRDARATFHPGHLDVRLPARGPDPLVTIAATVRFVARATRPSIDPERLVPAAGEERYLAPDEGLIRLTPTVRAIAHDLAAGAENAWEKLERFWAFAFRSLRFGFVRYEELDGADPLASLLATRWSDCRTGAALVCALCRATGIPARLVNGLLLYPSSPTNHYWLEALLPPYGWVPFDLSSWDLAAGDPADPVWSRFFFGRLDYRMPIARLPLDTLAGPGVRFPAAWYLLERAVVDGREVEYFDLASNALVYRDRITVRWSPLTPHTPKGAHGSR